MFEAVEKQSLSDAVFQQLSDRILTRELPPDAPLPSERALCDMLGVNRGAVREALRRLQQAGLVRVRQGGKTQVQDYLREGGLELLESLLVDGDGSVRVDVARGVVDMRAALAPAVARAAADRQDANAIAALGKILDAMQAETDLKKRQMLAFSFWDALVDAADNIAYRLAFNSLRKTYLRIWDVLTGTLADEFLNSHGLADMVEAIADGDGDRADAAAKAYITTGTKTLHGVLDALTRETDK